MIDFNLEIEKALSGLKKAEELNLLELENRINLVLTVLSGFNKNAGYMPPVEFSKLNYILSDFDKWFCIELKKYESF